MKTPKWFQAISLAFVAATAAACGPRAAQLAGVDGSPTTPVSEYRIGSGDELNITVWGNEQLTRTVAVRPDGMISLPLLNDVKAVGLTPMELRNDLAKKLTKFINRPEVSVGLASIRSFKVSVVGEVRKPGTFEMNTGGTVLDALAQAEGLNDFASRGRIFVLRRQGGETTRLPFNYRQVVSSAGQGNFYLRPGDVVVVP